MRARCVCTCSCRLEHTSACHSPGRRRGCRVKVRGRDRDRNRVRGGVVRVDPARSRSELSQPSAAFTDSLDVSTPTDLRADLLHLIQSQQPDSSWSWDLLLFITVLLLLLLLLFLPFILLLLLFILFVLFLLFLFILFLLLFILFFFLLLFFLNQNSPPSVPLCAAGGRHRDQLSKQMVKTT